MSLPGLKLTMSLILFTNKNKTVAHEVQPGVTDILTTDRRHLWSIPEETHGNMESIWFIDLLIKAEFIIGDVIYAPFL